MTTLKKKKSWDMCPTLLKVPLDRFLTIFYCLLLEKQVPVCKLPTEGTFIGY